LPFARPPAPVPSRRCRSHYTVSFLAAASYIFASFRLFCNFHIVFPLSRPALRLGRRVCLLALSRPRRELRHTGSPRVPGKQSQLAAGSVARRERNET
jgi:hypothetical protein